MANPAVLCLSLKRNKVLAMITVRLADLNDLDQLAQLFDLYRSFYYQPTDVLAAYAFLEERIERKESVILIAENQHNMVGFTQLYPIFSSVGLRRTWLLNDLYVHPDARKQGVAALLLNAAKNYGIQTGAKWLLLQTGNENSTAQSVYEKNGWKKLSDFFYELPL
jgi:ribosomal protein S18 acetylase RimI-like enzyme